ncbi:hypothetical protein MKZ38_003888 [Zalerion maritima]|uniref:Uncharacterized protein n=1 Tax=Zalerion maritima TaxID=339359 RepID=A0AAD5WX00_9PEZI|nr:hypothetical protein MKZ38_003888 [Zalerion maritima]
MEKVRPAMAAGDVMDGGSYNAINGGIQGGANIPDDAEELTVPFPNGAPEQTGSDTLGQAVMREPYDPNCGNGSTDDQVLGGNSGMYGGGTPLFTLDGWLDSAANVDQLRDNWTGFVFNPETEEYRFPPA